MYIKIHFKDAWSAKQDWERKNIYKVLNTCKLTNRRELMFMLGNLVAMLPWIRYVNFANLHMKTVILWGVAAYFCKDTYKQSHTAEHFVILLFYNIIPVTCSCLNFFSMPKCANKLLSTMIRDYFYYNQLQRRTHLFIRTSYQWLWWKRFICRRFHHIIQRNVEYVCGTAHFIINSDIRGTHQLLSIRLNLYRRSFCNCI